MNKIAGQTPDLCDECGKEEEGGGEEVELEEEGDLEGEEVEKDDIEQRMNKMRLDVEDE